MKIKLFIRAGLLVSVLIVSGILLLISYQQIFRKENSIAILPFRCLDQDIRGKQFMEGFQEQLIMDLDKTKDLEVISGITPEQFRISQKTIPEIGKELHADYIMEGSITLDDSVIRVWVQLLKTRTDKNIWASVYNGSIQNSIDFQSTVAKDIAGRLDVLLFSRKH